jgi:radical SAM superfamily enzyme YgiQ (UPF0313 family)
MAIQTITCIQLGGEFPDFCHRLVMPDYGLPVIATILAERGHDVKLYVEHVKPPDWDRLAASDLVCFSCLNAGADKTYRLAREIRTRLGIPTVIGGTHATYYPEACLDHCDYVVFGEGDETITDLVDTLGRGGDIAQVAGIAFKVDGRVRRTPPRPGPARFDTIPDFRLIDGYRRLGWLDVLRQRRMPLLTAQSSRGCHFKCTFCIINTMFPTGYRKRDVEAVIRDLRDKRQYGRQLMFVDNEFSSLRPYTKKLLRRMIEEALDFEITVFARVEIARDEELLTLMRQAGIRSIYQGYESVQPETLVAYDKRQTFAQMVAAIRKIQSFGFGLMGSFVVGADTDTRETIARTVDFVREHQLATAYLFPIWGHFPEQATGFQTITPWYRSIFRGWAYSDGHYVTHFPLRMRPSDLQRGLIDAYRAIYSLGEVVRALADGRFHDAKRRLAHRYAWQRIEQGPLEYVRFLEELEDGLYDPEGRLREDRLIERVRKDPRWTFQAGNRMVEGLGLSPLQLPVPRENNITCVPPQLGPA